MKISNKYLIGLAIMLLISGCGQPAKEKKDQVTGFKTNRSSFLITMDTVSPNKKNRNALMDEFIIKSDVQCQHYLDRPLTKAKKEDGMYMKVFDATSQAFGVKNITDGAKILYSGGDEDKNKDARSAYEKVLSPEIKRGVEIAREAYARKNMYSKKYKLIESYTNEMLEHDMQNYDKLCSHEVGLIEINKALKKRQKRPKKVTPFSPKVVIDPVTIENKVEAVTEKIEAEKETESNVTSEAEDINETGDPVF
ncbi:hypothetical protein [Sulfurovum sp.]|uniref:hypothetical protein n=1 Tax=Sulfurovum sp. TaxID=1969726 RepID=UPI003561DE48